MMKRVLLAGGIALLATGCVQVISHADDVGLEPIDAGKLDAPVDVGPEVAAGPCKSEMFWTGGMVASAAHFPGVNCIQCHDSKAKTQFNIAGTIYASDAQHDIDNCNGIKGGQEVGAAVAVLDALGNEVDIGRISANGVGNFFATKMLPMPFRVKIISGGKERIKKTAITNGDCNFCHSPEGMSGAQGRLTLP